MAELEDVETNPFSSENAPAWQLVVEMRNYDVLMGILTVLEAMHNKDLPERRHLNISDTIYDAHNAGKLVSDPPKFGIEREE